MLIPFSRRLCFAVGLPLRIPMKRALSPTSLVNNKVLAMSAKVIGTHDGKFHCDEVLACFMLQTILPKTSIVRTRKQETLDTCDYVVDVGGKYSHEERRYDHHMREFKETLATVSDNQMNFGTKLSSAGLIFYHYGPQFVSAVLNIPVDDSNMSTILAKLYADFFEEVDGIDNGIEQKDGEPRYKVTTSLGSRVGRLNPPWNSDGMNPDDQFQKAMKLAGGELTDRLKGITEVWLPARSVVEESMLKRKEAHPSGEVLVMADGGVPWKSHLFDLEKKHGISGAIKFILYTDNSNNWRIQAVPPTEQSFSQRVPLPGSWRGLRDDALSDKSGIPGCVFVHSGGFIGGNKTYEGVLRMASETLLSEA